MEWSIYNHLYYSKKAQKYLLYSALSNMFIELNNEGYKTILEIKDDPNYIKTQSKQYQFLIDKRFIVESNDNEKNRLVLSTLVKRFSLDNMTLTIAPTQSCNFNCPYCYESDKKNKKMTKRVQEQLLRFLKKADNTKRLHVVWYGGEPTMAIETIKYLSSKMQKIVENYSAYMVTNGFNLDKIVDSLEDMKISGLQITLDGTKATHDKTRHLLNGNGSFDKILSNIELLLLKYDNISISIRMNISPYNSNEYASLHKLLQSKFANKVNLYPAFVQDYNNCQVLCYEDCVSKAKFLKQLYYEDNIYTRPLYPTRLGKGCMRQTLNSYVVGTDGELYKCWHHIGMKDKIVGSIFEENIINH